MSLSFHPIYTHIEHDTVDIVQPNHCVSTLADDSTNTPVMASINPSHLIGTVLLKFCKPYHLLSLVE